MRLRSLLSCFVVSAILAIPSFLSAGDNSSFYLKNDDTVVFYGDSITEQNFYNQWIEQYVVTRFPRMRVHFYGAGVGGDRVTGGKGGDIDTRLARDVFSRKPSVVTVMLGMNDGHYTQETEQITGAYVAGYEHLLESIHVHLPGARITVLGPSPYDDVTRPDAIPGGYNATMIHFAALDKELAREHSYNFVDFNPPVVRVLKRAEALDPLVAQLLIPGRVHPDTIVHWVMAETLLDDWNAPRLVSSVTIDAAKNGLVSAENATVDHVERNGGELRWVETDGSLPLPFDSHSATVALLQKLTDIQEHLDQEPLRVLGLQASQYQLTIDAQVVGTFRADELAKGVNLARYETPMLHQAYVVGNLIGLRDQVQHVHMWMSFTKAKFGRVDGRERLLGNVEDSLEDAIYTAAVPKSHVFSLAPIGETAN